MDNLSDAARVGDQPAIEWRVQMVSKLVDKGIMAPESPVAKAMLLVPRHQFAPDAPLSVVYDLQQPVPTICDSNGKVVSSVTSSELQARVLVASDIRPGMRVLEIGSGGYNAALLAELVGESGHVTSLDFDDRVIANARIRLAATGHTQVELITADSANWVDSEPFDRIIVTVGMWDIPHKLLANLSSNGLLTVPLRLRGAPSMPVFRRQGSGLVSIENIDHAGFIPVEGQSSFRNDSIPLFGREVMLTFDERVEIDVEGLEASTASGQQTFRMGIVVPFEAPWSRGKLLIASKFPGMGLLSRANGYGDSPISFGRGQKNVDCVVEGSSLAYLSWERIESAQYELVAHGFGNDVGGLATRVAECLKPWQRNPFGKLTITADPIEGEYHSGFGIVKNNFVYTIDWH